MANQRFGVAVIGLGIAGANAIHTLARRGVRVLDIDTFAPPHSWGSSYGQTRLVRAAYAEGTTIERPLCRQSLS